MPRSSNQARQTPASRRVIEYQHLEDYASPGITPGSNTSIESDDVWTDDESSPPGTPDTVISSRGASPKAPSPWSVTRRRPVTLRRNATYKAGSRTTPTYSRDLFKRTVGTESLTADIGDDPFTDTPAHPKTTRSSKKGKQPSPGTESDTNVAQSRPSYNIRPHHPAKTEFSDDEIDSVDVGSPRPRRKTQIKSETIAYPDLSAILDSEPPAAEHQKVEDPVDDETQNLGITPGCALCFHFQGLDIAPSSLTTPGISCDKLNKLIPFDIQRSLNDSTPKAGNKKKGVQCVAFVGTNSSKDPEQDRKERRCSNHATAHAELDDIRKALKELHSAVQNLEDMDPLDRLPETFKLIYCGIHANSATNTFQKIDFHFKRLRNRPVRSVGTDKLAMYQLRWWVDSVLQIEHIDEKQKKLQSHPSGVDTWIKTRPKKGSLGFEPFQPPTMLRVPTKSALMNVVRSPLNGEETEHGGIYLYCLKGEQSRKSTGYVKIGVTHRDEKDRRKEWSRCLPDLDLDIIDLGNERNSQQLLPHVYRVEKLIHMELKEARRKRLCDMKDRNKGKPTHKYHTEFFEVEVHRAKAACQRWIEWILKKPYVTFHNEASIWLVNPALVPDKLFADIELIFPESKDAEEGGLKGIGRALVRRFTGRTLKES